MGINAAAPQPTYQPESLVAKRFKLGKDLCAYCGEAVATDREDPIPLGLYTPEARSKLPETAPDGMSMRTEPHPYAPDRTGCYQFAD
jgi:hypothetical protein